MSDIARNIDADKLIEMLNNKAKLDLEMGLYNHGALTQSFINFVERQPTADVVPQSEVVRCKDCKHFYQDRNVKVCRHWNCHSTEEDAYCSYAKMKGGAERVCTDCIHFVGCECFSGMTCDQYETEKE